MKSDAKFYDLLRNGLMGPTLTAAEVEGLSAITTAMAGAPLAWAAYALATAYHETAGTMQPVNEKGSDAYFTRMYDKAGERPAVAQALGNTQPGDGIRFHGRGYVQLTGRGNYQKADTKLAAAGLINSGQLVADPSIALHDDIAAFVMRRGMQEGWFTGKSFANYLPGSGRGSQATYEASRKIINGTDRAALIAGYAIKFEAALIAGGWA